MKSQLIFSLFLCFILASCASGPSKKEMEKALTNFELKSESSGELIDVYIYYSHGSGRKEIGDVAYKLDDSKEFIGKLFYGEYFHFQTTPGKHKISWRGNSNEASKVKYGALNVDFKQNETYIFNQVHAIIFNRYSNDGLSTISSLNKSKDTLKGKYYLSKTKESKATEACLKVKDVVMFSVLCQVTPNKEIKSDS
jgi:hypothetical protein